MRQQKHAPPLTKRVLSDIPEPNQKSGTTGATFNLTNAIVGSGIIGIPFTIKESGLVMGMFLLGFVSYLAVRSLRMIVETACFHPQLKMVGVKTYEDLMLLPFGKWGSLFILINKFIFAYGCMVAYLLIIKDTIPVIFGLHENELYRQLIMVGVGTLVVLPLSLLRDVASLALPSLISVAADVVLIVFMCIYAPVQERVNDAGGIGEVLKTNAINPHFFIGLGIISQAMTCHPQAFMVHGSLQDQSSYVWSIVTRNSLTAAWILCTIMGLVGFLGFLDDTQGDILLNFETGSIAANGSRGLVAITMIFTYPLQAIVARHVLAKIFFNGDLEGATTLLEDGTTTVPTPKDCFCMGRRQYIVVGMYIGTIIPALVFNDLGPVLSITGAIGGSSLAYIGPGLIYLGAHGEYFLQYTNEMMGIKTNPAAAVDPSIELPVEGDAEAKPIINDANDTEASFGGGRGGRSPWWWCLVMMPLWRAIAADGSRGMKLRLEQIEEESPGVTTAPPTGEVITAMNGDFYLAMFLVVFGVVAVVAGVASNVLVSVYVPSH